ncbi:SMP-30/gluconolactonase/LRE family protein [Mesorhizobium sp. B2-3-11]|uniref:SMP-30/gluconolactonase/LRE family protein n=1 Tax=Mesorhizobium sp. B2-3-11 TaxID=2589953 RepID=UPI0011297DB0|nr:SMP-30/gluconolactonase/LRE family protein [Mesorhizobium sp. B2-3-11]TPL97834.1 SMP-30/gluconolactonase/LRE family protein [Mesorhizobium sp. B2-3-11]
MPGDNTEWTISAPTRDRLGESILWHPVEQALYWIDFYGPTVHRQRRGSGVVDSWKIDLGETIGSLVLTDKGLLLALDHGLHLFDTQTGKARAFADPKNGQANLVYNDGKVDRAGRYWIGTYDVSERDPNAVFFRMGPSTSWEVADKGFVICNGPAFSPDNRRLYFSDTVGHRILRYELDDSGSISGRRVFFAFANNDGMPDGLAVDSAGNVWCALYGGSKVVCIDPKGTLRRSLYLPATFVTSLCFAGPDLKTLCVTTGWDSRTTEATKANDVGGAVFRRPVDIAGLPEPVLSL